MRTPEEISALRREIANIKTRMENDLEEERRRSREANERAERYLQELTALRRRLDNNRVATPERKEPDKAEEKRQLRPKKKKELPPPSDNAMEIEEMEEKIVLPPREEWPPVIRPPLGGKSMIIEDRPVDLNIKVVDADGKIISVIGGGKEHDNKKRVVRPVLPATSGELVNTIREVVAEEVRRAMGTLHPGAKRVTSYIRKVQ